MTTLTKVIASVAKRKHKDKTIPMCNVNEEHSGKIKPPLSVNVTGEKIVAKIVVIGQIVHNGKTTPQCNARAEHSEKIKPALSVNVIGVKTAAKIVVTGLMTVNANVA